MRPRTACGSSTDKVNNLKSIPLGQGGGRPMLLLEDMEIVFDSQTIRNQTQLPDKLLHRGPGLQLSGLSVHKNFNQSHGFPSPVPELNRPCSGSRSASKYRIGRSLWKRLVRNAPVSPHMGRLVDWEGRAAKRRVESGEWRVESYWIDTLST